jgi:hypothetical protein
MPVYRRRKQLNIVTIAGLIALVIANVTSYLLKRSDLPESVVDTGSGFAMGVAIGLLLLGIWLSARQMRQKDEGGV